MNSKIQSIKNQIKALNLGGMIVTNPVNIRYLTGLTAEGTLLLTLKESIFITDARFIEDVERHLTVDEEIAVYDIRDLNKKDLENIFLGVENVGFEEGYVTYELYQAYMQTYKVNLVETDKIIEKNRSVKEEDELDNIRKACTITDNAYSYIRDLIKVGMTEKEIAFELEKYMLLNGAESLAFNTIVAFGDNTSLPHAIPTDRKLKKNDIVQLDFGCKVNGYCSDFSRVIFMGDAVDSEVEKVYNFVLREYYHILNGLSEGADVKTVVKESEKDFKDENYDILHALGHSLGLDIHEDPVLSASHNDKYKRNMVLTVEPGVYFRGKYGIRIEDTVLINKNGCNTLTKSGTALDFARKIC